MGVGASSLLSASDRAPIPQEPHGVTGALSMMPLRSLWSGKDATCEASPVIVDRRPNQVVTVLPRGLQAADSWRTLPCGEGGSHETASQQLVLSGGGALCGVSMRCGCDAVTWNVDPDYIDVAERIRLFYEQYPDGRLTTERPWVESVESACLFAVSPTPTGRPMIVTPSTGVAWEPVPGPTPFTKDSELMNAQTSAWGRAIVAAGIPSKKIASAEDVKARTDAKPATDDDKRTDAQNRKLNAVIGDSTRASWIRQTLRTGRTTRRSGRSRTPANPRAQN